MTGRAFVAYVRADDEADGGRILQIARDIGHQFAAITANQLDLVIDQDHLRWGDGWRTTLTDAVTHANFLIAFISPRFFLSVECRRELELFLRTATEFGRRELVLPILYIDVPDLNEDSDDHLKQAIATIQRVDFTDVRFEDPGSSIYRRAVYNLALELSNRTNGLSDPATDPVVLPALVSESSEGDPEEPGLLDLLSEGIDGPSGMLAAMNDITAAVVELGELMTDSTSRMVTNADPKRMVANRVLVSNQLAKALEPVADRVEEAAQRYRSSLDQSSAVIEALFGFGAHGAGRETAIDLARSLIKLEGELHGAFTSAEEFIELLRGIENFSRSLRRPISRLRGAIQTIRDTEPLVFVWADDARDFLTKNDED